MRRGALSDICVTRNATVRAVTTQIDGTGYGIALVVDRERRLEGTITDGDIRRAMLAGLSLDAPASELLRRKADSVYARPVTAAVEADRGDVLQLMRERSVRQVPLLDATGRVADLVTLEELVPDDLDGVQAVIMAGGRGTRLRPLTEDLPKPLVPVGGRPLMELLIQQLRDAGFRRVHVTTHFHADKIASHFGDGSSFGIEISYLTEGSPLGTAGGLSLIEGGAEPLLVVNGDILTRVDFRAMLAYHREVGADLTVAVRRHAVQVPYGVIELEGVHVKHVREKPTIECFINAGIYLLEPSARQFIPAVQPLDMTSLIQRLIDESRPVAGFPIVEYWLDIGRPSDYEQAQRDVREW